MRKFYFICLAILLLFSYTGLAQAQLAVDPTAGPEVWVTSVYNNSSSTVSKGDLVIWEIDASTGDNDNYVNTTTTADTTLVAGIVYPANIAAKTNGSIAVRAMGITVNTVGGMTTGTSLCSGITAGKAGACSEPADDGAKIGFCTSAETSATCVAYISVL